MNSDIQKRAEELRDRIVILFGVPDRHDSATVAAIADALAAAEAAGRERGIEEAAEVPGEFYAKYTYAMLQERYTDQEKAKASAAKTYACNDITVAIRQLAGEGGE